MFDISQTDPPHPPAQPRCQKTLPSNDDHGVFEPLTAYLHSGGWEVVRQPLTRASGYTDLDRHVVVIGRDPAPEHAAKTLIHEAAHITLQPIEDINEYRQHRGRMGVET